MIKHFDLPTNYYLMSENTNVIPLGEDANTMYLYTPQNYVYGEVINGTYLSWDWFYRSICNPVGKFKLEYNVKFRKMIVISSIVEGNLNCFVGPISAGKAYCEGSLIIASTAHNNYYNHIATKLLKPFIKP